MGKNSRVPLLVTASEYEKLITIVLEAHRISKGTYGTRRISEEVEAHGTACGKTKAGTLMKLAGVAAKQKRKFKVTTDSKHNLPIAPSLLNREFKVKERDHFYVSDIRYIWTNEGRLYNTRSSPAKLLAGH